MANPVTVDRDDVGPGRQCIAITPSDSSTFVTCRSIYVGVSGDITLVDLSGTAVLFKAVPQGTWVDVWTNQVKSTGTTATNLVGVV